MIHILSQNFVNAICYRKISYTLSSNFARCTLNFVNVYFVNWALKKTIIESQHFTLLSRARPKFQRKQHTYCAERGQYSIGFGSWWISKKSQWSLIMRSLNHDLLIKLHCTLLRNCNRTSLDSSSKLVYNEANHFESLVPVLFLRSPHEAPNACTTWRRSENRLSRCHDESSSACTMRRQCKNIHPDTSPCDIRGLAFSYIPCHPLAAREILSSDNLLRHLKQARMAWLLRVAGKNMCTS